MTTATLLRRILSRSKTSGDTNEDEQGPILSTTQRYSAPPVIMRIDETATSHNKNADLAPLSNPSSTYSAPTAAKPRRSNSLMSVKSHERRPSYDSVREQSDIPQSFAKTSRRCETSTPQPHPKEAVGGDRWIDVFFGTYRPSPPVSGRRKSNSFSHLPRLARQGVNAFSEQIEDSAVASRPQSQRQLSAIEALPSEMLDTILWLVHENPLENEYVSRAADLASCLQVSRTMHSAAIGVLYQRVSIPHSMAFSKFMAHILKDPEIATMTKRLDFSRYNNIDFGRTRQGSSEIMNVTPRDAPALLGTHAEFERVYGP